MKKIIVTSFLLISLIIISTLNTVNGQLNVPHGWKDDGGTNPIYPVANDYSVNKQICIGTNTANLNVSLTIVGSQTVTGNMAIGTSTTKSDTILNVVGSVTVSQGIKFGDNTTLTSTGGLVTTTAIQDIAHGGTAGTTAASALVNLGAVSTTAIQDIAHGGTAGTTAASALVNLGAVSTTAIQDIAHGGTAGTTSANALSNLGGASSSSPTFTGTSIFNGNVVIGTTQSEFRLTLDKGAGTPDGGILSIGTFGSGATLATADDGTRMIWYPKKAAFRAGRSGGTQWDDANIGNYSVAFGWRNTASGSFSTALGDLSDATGSYSIAGGYGANATGFQSTAFGYNTTASGNYATAIGRDMTVSGTYSVGINLLNATANVTNANTMAIMGGVVGIGTTTPQTILHVYGAGETTLATIGVNMPAGSITASTIFLSCNTTDGMQGGITGSAVPGVITFVTQTSAHLSQLTVDSEIPKIGQVVELTGDVMQSSLTQYLPTCRLCKTKESSAVYGIYLGVMSDNKSLEIAKATKPPQDQLSDVVEGINKIKDDYEFLKSARLEDIEKAKKDFVKANTPTQDLTPVQTGIDIAGDPIMGIVPVKPYELTRSDKNSLDIPPSQSELSAMDPSIHTILSQEYKVCNIGGGGTIPAIVSDVNGNITYGDLLTSDGEGNCMKQSDNIIRNSTVGKASVSVDWAKEPVKTKLIGILGYSG